MSDLYLLSRVQFNRIRPHFPLSYGIQRVDDLRVVSGKKLPLGMVRTRRFIIVLSAGAGWMFPTASSPPLQAKRASRINPSQSIPDGSQPPKKGMFPDPLDAPKVG
jgi:hypothetical protein